MAKKEKKSGLGRGLDSLIPKIEEKEVEEGTSLEDILKSKKTDEEVLQEQLSEEKTIEEEPTAEEEKTFVEEPVDEEKELVFTEEDFNDEEIPVEEEEVEKYEEEIVEEEVDDELLNSNESSTYTNVFYNDDEKIDEKISAKEDIKNINSTINLNEDNVETDKNIEASNDVNEAVSLLSEKEEKLIDEVIETVENNPRITLWSARSAAVLRFLRKTEPEFSISNEASNLIDAAIAEKYPEIWTLFNHL